MVDSGFATEVTDEQLRRVLTTRAPNPEQVSPTAGTGDRASRDDHVHPRLSSATVTTLDSTSKATIMFTRSFATMPCVQCLLVEAANAQPVIFKVESWVQDAGGAYTGCVVRGYRARQLPDMGLLTLVTAVVSALTNYNVFGGSAANAQFCCLAIQPSN